MYIYIRSHSRRNLFYCCAILCCMSVCCVNLYVCQLQCGAVLFVYNNATHTQTHTATQKHTRASLEPIASPVRQIARSEPPPPAIHTENTHQPTTTTATLFVSDQTKPTSSRLKRSRQRHNRHNHNNYNNKLNNTKLPQSLQISRPNHRTIIHLDTVKTDYCNFSSSASQPSAKGLPVYGPDHLTAKMSQQSQQQKESDLFERQTINFNQDYT